MTDNTLPEVGSRWTLKDGAIVFTVSGVAKRGRGWQVRVSTDDVEAAFISPIRLADFRKQAKPA